MPLLEESPAFTGPPEIHTFAGVLFDMDGTIVDSTDAIVKHWHKIGKELGVDPEVILRTSHGRRSIDLFQLYDPTKANWEYVSHVEGLIPKQFGSDAVEVPGARDLLASMEEAEAPWAIVTSGTRALVTGWLSVMKLAQPKNMVFAEDVSNGKPDPECYELGKQKMGLSAEARVLVIEDAPAGIAAGKAAGCKVIGLVTTHSVAQVKESKPDWIVKDLRSVKFVNVGGSAEKRGEVRIEISGCLTTL